MMLITLLSDRKICLPCPYGCQFCQNGSDFVLMPNNSCINACPGSIYYSTFIPYMSGSIRYCMPQSPVTFSGRLGTSPLSIILSFEGSSYDLLLDLMPRILISKSNASFISFNASVESVDSIMITFYDEILQQLTLDVDLVITLNFSDGLSYTMNNIRYNFDKTSLNLTLRSADNSKDHNQVSVNVNSSISSNKLQNISNEHPLSDHELKSVTSSSHITMMGGRSVTYMLSINQIHETNSMDLLGAGFCSEMLQLLRYINITQPSKLVYYFNQTLASPISLNFGIKIRQLEPENYEQDKGRYIEDGGPYQFYEVTPYFLSTLR